MHIFIGIPTHSGAIQVECLASIFSLREHLLATAPHIGITLSWVTGTPIDIARNVLAARFMQSSATHLFFIDDDMGFAPSLVDRLLTANKPISAPFCPERAIRLESLKDPRCQNLSATEMMAIATNYVCAGNILHENGLFDPTPDGFLGVSSIGTGLMLIRREVFEIIGRDAALWRPANDKRYLAAGLSSPVLQAFAPMQDETGVWLSEDISFCRRWTNAGGQIWACVDEEITHVGRLVVRGRFRSQLDFHEGLPKRS